MVAESGSGKKRGWSRDSPVSTTKVLSPLLHAFRVSSLSCIGLDSVTYTTINAINIGPFSRKRRGECPIKTRIGRNGKGAPAAESRSRSTCFGRKLGFLEAELTNGVRSLLGDRGDAVTTPPKPGEYIGADIGWL